MDILPAVEEANSISEELDKKKKFNVELVSPEGRGELTGRQQVRPAIYILAPRCAESWHTQPSSHSIRRAAPQGPYPGALWGCWR